MKLLKKLLPIASVASVAAIVAPIATSCNNGNVIDGYTRLVPTVAQAVADADHAETGYKPGEAIQLYLKNVKDNPEVFVQDIKAVLSGLAYDDIHPIEPNDITPQYRVELNYSNFVVDTTEGAETMSFNAKGSIYIMDAGGIDDFDITNIEITAKKLPYIANHTLVGWQIMSLPALGKVPFDEDQSVEVKLSGSIFGDSPAEWYSFDNESIVLDNEHSFDDTLVGKWSDVEDLLAIGLNIVGMGSDISYHMANIKYNPA